MKKLNPHSNAGFALAELMLTMTVAAVFFAGAATFISKQRTEQAANEQAMWIAQYVNGLAAYMSIQGVTPPATLTVNGTDWLKSTVCGGLQPPSDYLLSCDIPTNFNGSYGMPAPSVTFDWSVPTGPRADITFGSVRSGGLPSAKIAALLASSINSRLEVDGYIHASVFSIDGGIDPVANPGAFRASIIAANLTGSITSSITSTVFVRRDGNTVMKGPLVTEHDNWAMIARDEAGNENAAAQSNIASANVNDVYVRSNAAWASETHALAEEAYRLAVRTPQFMTEVPSATIIPQPSCPAGLTAQIFTYPVIFVGGASTASTRFIAGIRTPVDIVSAVTWRVRMFILYEGSASWEEAPSDMGRISVTTRCS